MNYTFSRWMGAKDFLNLQEDIASPILIVILFFIYPLFCHLNYLFLLFLHSLSSLLKTWFKGQNFRHSYAKSSCKQINLMAMQATALIIILTDCCSSFLWTLNIIYVYIECGLAVIQICFINKSNSNWFKYYKFKQIYIEPK